MRPPVFEIDLPAFNADPYPFYARMHSEAPICHVPQLGATLLTRRDDIFVCEKNIEVFSSVQPQGLMTRLMGENMMRKDGESHAVERRQMFASVSPRAANQYWRQVFSAAAAAILDELEPAGSADLVAEYAMRLSGEALKAITGLETATWRDIDRWSQAMIDGIANYAGVAEVEARCHAATAEIDAAITQKLATPDADNDLSLISVMRRAGMPEANIRHNVKLAISGGQNEPRDAIAGVIHALLAHPDQLAEIQAGEATFLQAFEEYGRWTSPIGMSPRRIAKSHSWAGIDFEPEDRVFLMFGAANHDPSVFTDPERYDIKRDTSKSIVFGAGPHFCAGAHVARVLVADIGVPEVFRRLRGLKLEGDVYYRGWAFRGPVAVPVSWQPQQLRKRSIT